MTAATQGHTEIRADVAGHRIRVLGGGTGRSLVMLHHSTGNVGWAPIHARLAESFRVLAVDMPGFGQSDRPDWAREPRDVAILLNRLLDTLDLTDVTLVGTGFGGWVAAEMATMTECRLSRLVLIGAAGVQPREGYILDQVMLDFDEYVRAGFSDETAYTALFGEAPAPELRELWDFSREMVSRITWKPYMFSLRLPSLLPTIASPTLIIWGAEDQVVPLDCARQYQELLPTARLELVEGAGHLVELERPEAVVALVRAFAGGQD